MNKPEISVYGANWCPDRRRSKKFLGERGIEHKWVDIEQDPEGLLYIEEVNKGNCIVPTIVFGDGSILVEPSSAELAAKLDLVSKARLHFYNLIIVGGGPAGLTASIYAAREGVETLLIEESSLGGQEGITQRGVFVIIGTMPNSTAKIFSFTVATDEGETFGPSIWPTPTKSTTSGWNSPPARCALTRRRPTPVRWRSKSSARHKASSNVEERIQSSTRESKG